MNPELSRVRVKICGITRIEDALTAAHAGADAIGLVFYPASPRAVDPGQARELCAALPAFVSRVGLFVNESAATVDKILSRVPLDTLQFHGDESPEQCAAFGLPYIKSVGMREGVDLDDAVRRYAGAAALLLDQFDRTRWGGTGERFDWQLVPAERPVPIVLAGGLDSSNVSQAVAEVRPYGVDVSGGVEVRRGIKDPQRIRAFMRGVLSV
jgi:phosphoribosylanthranilate isomerase